ncbi:hypothetical protein GJ842_27515 [Salmonella enterica]|nr:hypothetical protein [Salmonella enterica subsp. enterica serovar Enteritidis]ECI5662689.1 hypothetical protein [Salmonella enterica subsp. diarizonae]EDZ9931930.1 hypothetical protein [Salmonella enterica]EJD3031021.1 hypothetical protein [Salmonella enterica]
MAISSAARNAACAEAADVPALDSDNFAAFCDACAAAADAAEFVSDEPAAFRLASAAAAEVAACDADTDALPAEESELRLLAFESAALLAASVAFDNAVCAPDAAASLLT